MGCNSLSALIITFNEQSNIERTLNSICWIPHILIVDSGSTDKTIEIASGFKNTAILYREFDSFANQCNFGLRNLRTDWVLSLDADYVLTSDLSEEIYSLLAEPDRVGKEIRGFSIDFSYCINGKPIRSGLLPPRTCLYWREAAMYFDEGHGHRVSINGKCSRLRHKILHDDRKPVNIWLTNQQRYQEREALNLYYLRDKDLSSIDLLRKHTPLTPFISIFLSYIVKGGFLDGKEGLIYALQRFIAESLLYLYIHLGNNSEST